MHDTHFGSRYEHVLGALLSVGGKGLREELSKQMKLVQLLGGVAEKVRQASGSIINPRLSPLIGSRPVQGK